MKLKNRIIVGFMMIILMPMLLLAATLFGISEAQHRNSSGSDTVQESAYDITIADTGSSQTSIQIMTKDLFFTALVILIFTSVSIGLWIYRSVAAPLVKLRKATQNIKEGNLDFVLEVDGTDEFAELCRDFEEMRRRLKESAPEDSMVFRLGLSGETDRSDPSENTGLLGISGWVYFAVCNWLKRKGFLS